jgi:hypothetical protein
MARKVVRTLLVGLITGLVLVLLLIPGLDAMGRILLMPPLYEPAARGLVAAFWLAGMGAAWAYEPVGSEMGEDAVEPAPDPSAQPGGP